MLKTIKPKHLKVKKKYDVLRFIGKIVEPMIVIILICILGYLLHILPGQLAEKDNPKYKTIMVELSEINQPDFVFPICWRGKNK